MNKENAIKFLIPLVAVVVIIESVLLVINLSENKVGDNNGREMIAEEEAVIEIEGARASVSLMAEKETIKVGESLKVNLLVNSDEELVIDGIDAYVSYPKELAVSNFKSSSQLPRPDFSIISDKKNMVVGNYLISGGQGLKFDPETGLEIYSFEVKASAPGEYDLVVATGDEGNESATMITENGPSEGGVPFNVNNLKIIVEE